MGKKVIGSKKRSNPVKVTKPQPVMDNCTLLSRHELQPVVSLQPFLTPVESCKIAATVTHLFNVRRLNALSVVPSTCDDDGGRHFPNLSSLRCYSDRGTDMYPINVEYRDGINKEIQDRLSVDSDPVRTATRVQSILGFEFPMC